MMYTDEAPTLYDVVNLYGEDYEGAMSDYPIWDESKRAWLNNRIYEKFAFREIGTDTPAKFLFFLRRRMNDMMPTVNPMFAALEDVDILEGYETFDDVSADSKSSAEQANLYSATPQTQLSNAKNYATNLTQTEGENAGESTQKSRHYGRSGTVGDMVGNWAMSVNNALYIVYNGIEPLFNQIWKEDF